MPRFGAEAHMPPDIAQLAEHLTVDIRSHQMVPGSIPGVRIFVLCVRVGCVWYQLCERVWFTTIKYAETRDRAGDLQIFSLTLSQLSYRGLGTLSRKHQHRHMYACGERERALRYASVGSRARATLIATMYPTSSPLMVRSRY